MSRHPRNTLVGAFVVTCLIFAVFPLSIHFRLSAAEHADRTARILAVYPDWPHLEGHLNKDYGLWYRIGLVARSDRSVYPPAGALQPDGKPLPFPFMYPPFAGAVLAWLSHLGQTGMLVALVLANIAAWFLAGGLSVKLVAGPAPAHPLVWGLPSALCVFFIYEMFLLGQPNLGLLVLLLAGFHLLRADRQGLAGAAFAAAAALKAFPAVVLVYLLWRRHWLAAAGMVLTTAVLVVVVPVPTRGWEQNLSELRRWADGMIFKGGADGVGQRPEQSQGWRNQSLLGVGHRLLRPVNAEADDFRGKELYVNVLSLDYKTASLAIAGACGLLGLAFVGVLPRSAGRTRQTDAAEFALLSILVMVGTPYAFGYYFVWLVLPLTVLTWFAVADPSAAVRWSSWAWIGAGFAVVAAGAPVFGTRVPAAVGAFLWGSLVLAAGLGGHLWRLGRRGTMSGGGAT